MPLLIVYLSLRFISAVLNPHPRCPLPLRDALAACSCRRPQGEADEALTCLVNKKDESEL